jgi:NAD-dependent deacetylase
MPHSAIVVLTGAGISAESGLKTFRDNDGLWEGHSVLDVATPESFHRNPELVNTFYNQRRAQLLGGEVHPNAAHLALASFEANFNGEFTLVTQNVDDLHERAGSVSPLHMHGSLLRAKCAYCEGDFDIKLDLDHMGQCLVCARTGGLRPDIVWFGEMPMHMETIEERIRRCDLFISIGTSAAVYPAAGFSDLARICGAKTVELNLAPSQKSDDFSESILGPATDLVPKFFKKLLAD